MNHSPLAQWIAFSGNDCIASGVPENVATDVKRFVDSHPVEPVLVSMQKRAPLSKWIFGGLYRMSLFVCLSEKSRQRKRVQ